MSRLLFAILALSILAAAAPAPSPENMVRQFYVAYWTLKISGGVPDGTARSVLAPYLSAPLAKKLGDADTAERRYAQRTRGEVPPLVEGDLFTSLFEGASGLDGVTCTQESKIARCTAQLRYQDPGSKDIVRWSDEIQLVQTDTGWRIDDITYGGTWEFMHKGRLRDLLDEVVRQADAPLN